MSKAKFRIKRIAEWAKTALIVLLTASALLLAWRTGLFRDFIGSVPFFGNVADLVRGATGAAEPVGTVIKEAARPLCIVITNEAGGRFGAKYDTDVRDAIYEMTSSIIGEALGSASEPAGITEDEWREALSGAGVYFEYITPVRLSVLAGWLGQLLPETVRDAPLRRIFIAFSEDRSRLYYQDHEGGGFFGADTASAAGKAQGIDEYGSNGVLFAFETGIAGSASAPYMPLMSDREYRDVQPAPAGSPEQLLGLVLTTFGHINESSTTYQSGGALVCVGTQFNIRAFPDGRVVYRRTDVEVAQAGTEAPDAKTPDADAPDRSSGEMIEQARALIADSIGKVCGSANAAFESFESEGVYASVYFGYHLAGGRVFLNEERYAARVSFVSGVVAEVEMNFRNYTFTEEYTRLLPEKQALAAAGGEFLLCYADAGTDVINPAWVVFGF